ncbi:MAK10-like protein [Tanacetum coccineum]
MGDENPIRTLGDYSKSSHKGYRNTIELPVRNNVVPLRSDTIWLVKTDAFHGLQSEDPNQHLKDFLKLVDSLDLDGENRERTRMRLFPFSLRDQDSNWLERLPAGFISTWEDLTTRFLAQFFPPGRTAKLRNDILMFQQHHGESLMDSFQGLTPKSPSSWHRPLAPNVPSTSDRRLIELENQVQRLMKAHLAPTQPTQVNKITTPCEICSGTHDTPYFMEDPEQTFIDYASSHTDEAIVQVEADFKRQQGDTVKNPKLSTTPILSARSYPTIDPQCSTQIHSSINAITIHPKQPEESQVNEPDVEQEEGNPGNTNSNPHPQPNPLASITIEQVMFIEIIRDNDEPQIEGPNNGEGATIKEPVVEYFNTFSTRDELTYHKKLDPRENANGGINNFTGRIKGMHVFMGNFTYVIDFMIVDDISSIIDLRLSQAVLGEPIVEISNMTHDPPEGVVRFIKGYDEVAYKMPHKIEQYDSLSDLEKEHTKSVYLRNEEDKRRGVEYVMSKILGFYKECLELGYLTGIDDEGEVTIDQGVGSTSGIRACALRNFDLGKMELENSQNNALAKLPMLKLGEYEMWEIRIKQYFQIQDYALWELYLFNQLLMLNLFAAIKARFGGNEATKRTQKALLKQQLQKLVSRLAILGVVTPPEDLNVKFLRSLPSEGITHMVVWMTNPNLILMGLDDLYKNFKIVEQKVKKSTADNNDEKNLAFLTTSSPSSTNTINIVNTGVSTGTTKVNTASTETSTASFSDATVYAFLSTQPQGFELVHEDREQLHDDDLEEMDLKWNMALLSMRARKFYQRTGRKIIIDGSSTAGYDKSKAVRIEDASEKVMCAIDGAGFDWGDMAKEEIQANMALMAFTDSEVSNDKSCSKSCLQNYEALKKQYDDLLVKLDDTGFKAATYKRGLSILEAQVVKYKDSEFFT